MLGIKTIAIIVLAFLGGTMVNDIHYVIASNGDCSNIPTFHSIYISKLVDCLQKTDNEIRTNLDATNNVFFNEIKRLETKINAR